MAEYDGVHIRKYQVRGVEYVGLWWYKGQGSKRDTKALGRAKDWTKATLNRARLDKEKELALQPGRVAAGKSPTLGAWFKQWKRDRTDVAASTLVLMEATVKKLDEYGIGEDRRIDKVTRAEASAWRAWMIGQGMSEPTVCKHVRCASSLFGERSGAASVDLIPFNPFSRLRKNVKTPVKGFPNLSEQEEDKLIDAATSPAWRAYVAILLMTGCRRSEPLQMRWSKVHWGEGRLQIPSIKTSRAGQLVWRDCKMVPRLEQVLLECYEQADPGEDHVVPLSLNNVNRDFLRLIEVAGLKVWADPFRGLRRRRASLWKAQYPASWVNIWLGHSESVSRGYYISVPPDAYKADESKAGSLIDKIKTMDESELNAIEELLNKDKGTL